MQLRRDSHKNQIVPFFLGPSVLTFLYTHELIPRQMKLMTISGEIEYGEIFFKDKPPLNFGDQWDQDWFKVPFPFITYSMFIAFVIAVTFLAFNVLVGLTVDDIRKFLGNADLRKLSMRLEFIRQMEQVKQII